jgi:uncharacterized protein (DUF2147 family)
MSRIRKRRFLIGAAAFALLGAALGAAAAEPTPVGTWRTYDDHTGKARSIVRIYEDNGKLFGRIESSLDPARAGRICDLCKDDRKNQRVVGMVIIRGLTKDGEEFGGGDILDPDNGKIYRCKIRVTEGGGKLSVRGFIGISLIGRSQTWTRER